MKQNSEKNFTFSRVTGTLIGANERSRTETYSSSDMTGGASIKSRTHDSSTLWIKSDDGKEHEFNLSFHINVREGHRLSMITVTSTNTGKSELLYMLNLTTEKCHALTKLERMHATLLLDGLPPALKVVIGCTLLGALSSGVISGVGYHAGIVFIFSLIGMLIGVPAGLLYIKLFPRKELGDFIIEAKAYRDDTFTESSTLHVDLV